MEELKRITQNFGRDRTLAKIRTCHLQNTKQSHFKSAQPVRWSIKDLTGGGCDLLHSEVHYYPSICWEFLTKIAQITAGLRTGWNRVGIQDENLLSKFTVLPPGSSAQFCHRLAYLISRLENLGIDSQKVLMYDPERFWAQEWQIWQRPSRCVVVNKWAYYRLKHKYISTQW